MMEHFLKGSQHPVFELELLPVVIALCVWEKFLRNCQIVFYLDNEAARGALISGATPSESGSWLVRTFTVHEMHGQLKVWFARVPTSSNVADKPSRLDVTELNAEGVDRVIIDWNNLWEQIQKYRSDKWVTVERDRTLPFAPRKKGVLRVKPALEHQFLDQLFFVTAFVFEKR